MDTLEASEAMFAMKSVKLAHYVDGKPSTHQGKIGVIVGLHKPWRGFCAAELHVDIRWADGTQSAHRRGRVELA